MPLSPELKILDLIIEAADEASRFNPLSSGAAFALFSNKLLDIQSKIKAACSCGECNAEKTDTNTMLLPLSKCCNSKLRFVERGCKAGKIVCGECLKIQDENQTVTPHLPQETGEEEYWKIFNKFHGCECGHEHPYKPETVAKIVSIAEAKGAEKERERILSWIDDRRLKKASIPSDLDRKLDCKIPSKVPKAYLSTVIFGTSKKWNGEVKPGKPSPSPQN